MKLETLYARNLHGKIKTWSIETWLENAIATIRILYGLLGSDNLQDDRIFITEGKNIGRANQTNPKTQADKEAIARWNKKKKEGYKTLTELGIQVGTPGLESKLEQTLPKFNLDDNFNIKPMKCQPFQTGKMNYPVIGQPKINGIRAIARLEQAKEGDGFFANTYERVTFRSKEGLEYVLPHIAPKLPMHPLSSTGNRNLPALDGELYIPGESLNRIRASVPMINSKGTVSNPSGNVERIQYWIFDLAIQDVIQRTRLDMLEDLSLNVLDAENMPLDKIMDTKEPIVYVPSKTIFSDDEAIEYMEQCLTLGFEGAVFRDMNAEYAFGSRPSTIRKLKQAKETECEILDIIPKPLESETALFVLLDEETRETFECNPVGTFAERKEYLDNKVNYIGKLATVKYYERSGVKGVPFHANVITIRDYE